MKRIVPVSLLLLALAAVGSGQNIYKVASGVGDDGIAIDSSGNLYASAWSGNRVRKVTPKGVVSIVAGTGTAGFSMDGGPATGAMLHNPVGLALDSSGNLYIGDYSNHRVRKVTSAGVISTIAGTGTAGYSGDGGQATSAMLNKPTCVAVDSSGNVYVLDRDNSRIRKVSADGTISTVAGTGTEGYSGDGGLATSAQLHIGASGGVAVDSSGNLYIADKGNHRVRKVSAAGIISTIAGTGSGGTSGDGGAATSAKIPYPGGLTLDTSGNIYVSQTESCRIRKIATDGIISTVAGTGTCSRSGDGGLATAAGLAGPDALALDSYGNLYIGDVTIRAIALGTANPRPDYAAKTAVFRAGLWVLDRNGSGTWDGPSSDRALYLGQSGDLPVVGDWNGDGWAKIGIFRNGMWVLDYNGNGQWDGPGTDRLIYLGQTGDVPVVGDWNGSGTTKVGIFRNGLWVLDYDGSGTWDGTSVDRAIYLGQTGDTPVVGDWNGGGTAKAGIFRSGLWVVDYNGNGVWNGTVTDKAFYLGQSGDTPVVGDWNGGGTSKAGVFRGGLWVLDYNGNRSWDGTSTDWAVYLGQAGDTPVVGDWTSGGTSNIGIFRAGQWVLDYNGSGSWDGLSADKAFYLGQSGDQAVIGTW